MTPERHALLKAVYMFVYTIFATDKSEVATHCGISKESALNALKKLESESLICRYDVNDEAQGAFRRGQFKQLTWQANHTYDDHTPEQAEKIFLDAIPAPANKES